MAVKLCHAAIYIARWILLLAILIHRKIYWRDTILDRVLVKNITLTRQSFDSRDDGICFFRIRSEFRT